MGIRDEMRLKLKREIKEVLRKNPEEDRMLGERKEPLLKGSRYGGVGDPEYLRKVAEVLELYNRLESSAEILPMIARENRKDLRKFAAIKAKYGDDKALGYLARINPKLRKIIEYDMRHNADIRAGGLAHPDGTITINTEEENLDTTLHEIRHQALRAQGWRGYGEIDEAFADAKSQKEMEELIQMKSNEWAKAYGKFNTRKYQRALKLIRMVENRYGTFAAVKFAKMLALNRESVKYRLARLFRH